MERVTGWFRRQARRIVEMPGWSQRSLLAMGFAAMVVFALLAIIGPLFASGDLVGEVDGQYPAQLSLTHPYPIQMAVDNTGNSDIAPLCLQFHASPASAITIESVDFQGIETFPVVHGVVCGGALATQETISISIAVKPLQTGPVTLDITPREGTKVIGTAYTGSMLILAHAGG